MRLPRFFNRRSRDPTVQKPTEGTTIQMVNTWGEHYIAWNGKLYESDLVMACVRPKIKAVGKLLAKHIREDAKGLTVNPMVNIRILLKYPNPYMSMQQFLEKMAYQLTLNGNAFALIVRDGDSNGKPMGLYPIECSSVRKIMDKQNVVLLEFTLKNGKTMTFAYEDILHLRQDFNENEFFGTNPAPALIQLMECVGTIDQGIVKAIKNSGIIRWLLKFNTGMRPEDVKKNVAEFVNNYLAVESDAFGAAGVDAKVDAKQIEPKDYVPNAAITDRITERIYAFFGTNKYIVQANYDENQWNAYYESEVEPIALQLGDVFTYRLFTRKEINFGNRIVFESSNLACASMTTKLNLVAFLDRGIMSANEIRRILNLPPIDGGDVYVRRLDTAPITEGGENDETQDKRERENYPE